MSSCDPKRCPLPASRVTSFAFPYCHHHSHFSVASPGSESGKVNNSVSAPQALRTSSFGCSSSPRPTSSATIALDSEPSWHRRLRKKRSQARFFLQSAKAAQLLDSHHGSKAPTMVNQWNHVGKGRGKNSLNSATKGKGTKGKGFAQWAPPPVPTSPFVNHNPFQLISPFMNAFNQAASMASPFSSKGGSGDYSTWSNIWRCEKCGASHPAHHTTCWDCSAINGDYPSTPHKGKTKGGKSAGKQHNQHQQRRAGRWRSWKHETYDNLNTNHNTIDADIKAAGEAAADDDPMGEAFLIGTPEEPSSKPDIDGEKLNGIIKWLQDKGVSKSIIGALTELKPTTQPCEPPRDPWRGLQSSKDKLKKISQQLIGAKDHLANMQKKMDDAVSWHDDLVDKKELLEKEVLSLQEEVGSTELVSKVHKYEDLIKQLQDKLQHGVPESKAAMSDVYNLLYKGKATTASVDTHEHADDDADAVNKQGFGFLGKASSFGPSAVPKVPPTPYSKGPAGPVGTGKGPQPGDPASVGTGSTEH